MFETSVVRAQARVATRRLSLLSVSVIAHTTIAFGAIVGSIASIEFPTVAPDEYSRAPALTAVQIPPPLGNPNGGAQRRAAAPAPSPAAPLPANQVTAPAVVPDEVMPLESTGTGDGETNPNATVEGPVGVPWGTEGSVGDLDAPPAVDIPIGQPQVEERVYQPHEVIAPVLVRKIDPRYPHAFVKSGVPATVVVRCVIDKSGNVRDPKVIVPAPMAPFNAEVLNVLPQWKYRPATLAGRPVDSYLVLTVRFAITR